MHFDEEWRNSASLLLQVQDLLFIKLVEGLLVDVDVFVAARPEEKIVGSTVPILVTDLFDHLLDFKEVEVQVIAQSTLLPLPGQTFVEETDVYFLGALITEFVVVFSDFGIWFSVSQTLSLF